MSGLERTVRMVLCGVVLMGAGAVHAGAQYVVVPNDLASVEGNEASEFLTGDARSTSVRYQQVFAASQFSDAGAITAIAFRPDSVAGVAFSTTISNVRVSLSTTAKAPDGLSTVFDENIGSDAQVVFGGDLLLSSADVAGPGGTRAFDIVIALTTPFSYDPGMGNLLFDFERDASTVKASFDAESQAGDPVSRVFGSRTSPVGQYGLDTVGLVARFSITSVPEPGPYGLLIGPVAMGFWLSRVRRRRRA